TVDNNGKASISHEKGAEISTNITKTNMSNDAVENIVKHYDKKLDKESKKENVGIVAKVRRDSKGNIDKRNLMNSTYDKGITVFGITFGEDRKIEVNVAKGTVHGL